ncbi:MAG: ATP-binding protein [Acidobacteriota bacterium]|nr:ATP-binding protein [Acidobacteriota bacterium]
MASGINERLWLDWLVKVRVIIITILLAIEMAIVTLTATHVSRTLFVLVILGWYAAGAVHLVLAARARHGWALLAKAQILCDLCFATAVIYLSGGIDTSFNFLYPLLIIVAATMIGSGWAYLTAGLSFVLFGGMLDLCYFEVIHSYSNSHPGLKSLQAVIFINLFAFFSVAYLASRLATRLRQADVALSDKSSELENLQLLHQSIVHCISSGLIITGLDGAIKLMNPAALGLLGRSQEEAATLNAADFFISPLPVAGAERTEVRTRTPAGAEKMFGVGCSALLGGAGDTIGYIYTFTDLTEIRHLERELRLRDRLAAVGRLAAGIAHEIRNPLSSIAGSVKMLSGIAALNDDQRELVGIVNRESERLNSIISDFLTYSRDRKFESARVDLCGLLRDTLLLLENRGEGIRLVHDFAVSEAWAEGDGDKLKQVFWNLASNAQRAMPSGGTLTVALDAQDGQWRIRFRDTGPGIAPQLIEKLFEPFQSGFEGGTGLGLAIVYRIMQAHDAHISVHSEPGVGTEFTLLFPPWRNAGEEDEVPQDQLAGEAFSGRESESK